MIFAVLERRLIQLLIKWLQFFINNIHMHVQPLQSGALICFMLILDMHEQIEHQSVPYL